MSVRIRLARAGAKKRPVYRVVVADRRCPRDGRFIERIGQYDPTKSPEVFEIDDQRLEHWFGHGAQPSPTVRSLLNKRRAKAPPAA